jgi:hypothetical protein
MVQRVGNRLETGAAKTLTKTILIARSYDVHVIGGFRGAPYLAM